MKRIIKTSGVEMHIPVKLDFEILAGSLTESEAFELIKILEKKQENWGLCYDVTKHFVSEMQKLAQEDIEQSYTGWIKDVVVPED